MSKHRTLTYDIETDPSGDIFLHDTDEFIKISQKQLRYLIELREIIAGINSMYIWYSDDDDAIDSWESINVKELVTLLSMFITNGYYYLDEREFLNKLKPYYIKYKKRTSV